MSSIELVRTALAVPFLAVTLYSAARLARPVTANRIQPAGTTKPTERVSDITHALMGLALAALVSGLGDVTPAVFWVLAFGALAIWFGTLLWWGGMMSRTSGDGGYNLHHLVGCIAMIYIFATRNVTVDVDGMGDHGLASLTSINWLFGLYFLVAATSLGFRVAEPVIRVTSRPAIPAGAGIGIPPPPPAQVPRVVRTRMLSSSSGLCTIEVISSAGMAFIFFSSL